MQLLVLVADISERLLKTREVCEILGISKWTLYRWIEEGRIRVVRIASGRYRIPESELRRIIEEVKKND